MAKDKTLTLADELEAVMDDIAALEEEMRPLKEREEQIRAELTSSLLKKGYRYIKTTSGLAFGIVSGRTTYAVKKGFEEKAMEWAQNEYPGILSIHIAKLNKIVGYVKELPEFIEKKEGEPHLAVRAQEVDEKLK